MASRVFYPLPEYYVFVAPPDVKIVAEGWENLGPEPEGRFIAFRKRNVAAGDSLEMTLSGGSATAASSEGAEGEGGESAPAPGSQIEIIPDRSQYEKAVIVLFMAAALAFGILKTLYPSSPRRG
jgi:hypothetical protein